MEKEKSIVLGFCKCKKCGTEKFVWNSFFVCENCGSKQFDKSGIGVFLFDDLNIKGKEDQV